MAAEAPALALPYPELATLCQQVRRDIIRMVYAVNSGHPGGSLGCVEYFVALYFHHLRHHPKPFSPTGQGEDVFILSNGHISPVFYSVLARSGYFPVEELNTFRKINSRLQGHPATAEHLPGVRVATGSLGQGFSVAIGTALSKTQQSDQHLVYALLGDGEVQEGQVWEAAMFAAHHKVENLIATIDLNYKQIDGDTRDILHPGDMQAKWEAFGWDVLPVAKGNDLKQVLEALTQARARAFQGRPVLLLLHTEMGYGVDYMQGTHEYHGKAPDAEGFASAMEQLPETELGDF